MQNRFSCAAFVAAIIPLTAAAIPAAGDETRTAAIALDGKPQVSIVVGARCSKPVRFAAEELQQTIRQMSGATCSILPDDAPTTMPIIAVGPPAENRATARLLDQAGVELEALNLGEEGFFLRTVDRNLVVAGGSSPRATLYAAYALLERLGCRWCFPARQGYVIPELSDLRLPELDQVERPAFSFRTFSHTVAVAADTIERIDWMAKNRMNRFLVTLYPIKGYQGQWYSDFKKVPGLLEAIQKRGIQIHAGHHASYFWTSPQEFYDKHPEFFAEIDGQRLRGALDGRRAQLCWSSSPQLAAITADRIVAFARENPEADVFSIWPDDDDNGYCQCRSCQAQKSMSNAYVTFANRVAEQVYRQNPRIQVSMLSYNKLSDPPTIPVFGKNTLCAVVCEDPDAKRLRGWLAAGPKDLVLYQLYMGSYSDRSLPGIWPHTIAARLKTIHELGLQGVTSQGEIHNFGAYALNYWTYARMIWNPTLPVDDVLRDYLEHYYREAAQPMQAYFTLLETLGRRTLGQVDIPPETIARLDQLLKLAEQAAASAPVHERITRDRMCLDYLILACQVAQSRKRLRTLREQGTLEETVSELVRSVHMCESCLYHLAQFRDERAFLSGQADNPHDIIGYRYTRRPYETQLANSRALLVQEVYGKPPDRPPADPPQEAAEASHPTSGVDGYSQGGVVVEGVAYFTANDGHRTLGVEKPADFPSVVAFDTQSLRKLRTYPFDKTYDSAPLVIQDRTGRWLVLAHEYKQSRTVARDRDTGDVVWITEANQPGHLFFGYSYYVRPDGSKLVLVACANGLHGISSETGKDQWWVRQQSTGGITPCVDQANGWIYYQGNARLLKINAADGAVLKTATVAEPNVCISWNTVLVNDARGYFVATYWYGKPEWDSALRVYDRDLNLLWQRTSLPVGTKPTMTYAEGKLVTGSGNMWYAKYTGDSWKYIAAYAIEDGKIAWKCDLSQHDYTCILNVPYHNGCFYAESQNMPHLPSKLFRIRAADGALAEVLDYGRALTSCAPCIIARGRLLSGDLWQDRTVVTQLAANGGTDWPGPFGDPQTHQNAAPPDPNAKTVAMREARDAGEKETPELNDGGQAAAR